LEHLSSSERQALRKPQGSLFILLAELLAGRDKPLANITTRDVALFPENYITEGKQTMAVILRSVLNDIFLEAIEARIIERNPFEPTRTSAPKIQKSRLSIDEFCRLLYVMREAKP